MNQMKHILIGLALLLGLAACNDIQLKVVADGEVTSETYSVSGFEYLNVAETFIAEVEISEEEGVRIETNRNIHEHVIVSVLGSTLYIELKDDIQITGPLKLKAYVSAKSLEAANVSGASSVILKDTIETSKFYLGVSGASNFAGALNVEEVSLGISGASNVSLGGEASVCTAEISGASFLRSLEMTCDTLNAEMSGASLLEMEVNNVIYINASGASVLRYKGDASIKNPKLSGGSTIQQVN